VSRHIIIGNPQRAPRLNTSLFRQVIAFLLGDLLGITGYRLEFQLLDTREMTRVNETFLHHRGPTDVIAFDYREPATPQFLHAEILLCVEVAARQARRYGTTWQAELVRYAIHGVLHLRGYGDKTPASRRKMKRTETRLLRNLARRFPLGRLGLPRRKP
jgi:probable rRNA maturation factor